MRELLSAVNGVLYYPILIIVLLACGFYFTIRTKFIQFGLLGEAFKVITEKPEGKDDVSSFQALMVSTASRVGTGNIVGVANAICLESYLGKDPKEMPYLVLTIYMIVALIAFPQAYKDIGDKLDDLDYNLFSKVALPLIVFYHIIKNKN